MGTGGEGLIENGAHEPPSSVVHPQGRSAFARELELDRGPTGLAAEGIGVALPEHVPPDRRSRGVADSNRLWTLEGKDPYPMVGNAKVDVIVGNHHGVGKAHRGIRADYGR